MTEQKTSLPAQNEGQRLLRELGKTGTELARALRVNKSAISNWLAGERKPRGQLKHELTRQFGIPAAAWEQRPSDKPPLKPRAAPPPREGAEPAPVKVRRVQASKDTPPLPELSVDDPLAGVRALVDRARVGIAMQGLSATEAKSWQDQLLSAMKMAQSLQHQEAVREDTILRSPAWTRVWGKIVKALEKHPDAMSAIIAAMRAE